MPVFQEQQAGPCGWHQAREGKDETGKTNQKVGGLAGHCKATGFIVTLGSLCLNGITIDTALRRDLREERQKQGD